VTLKKFGGDFSLRSIKLILSQQEEKEKQIFQSIKSIIQISNRENQPQSEWEFFFFWRGDAGI
jgi:hypothetical protein